MADITIYAIHGPDTDKLAGIITEMQQLGTPTIRVVDCGDHYMALEGSHRLAAAHSLGLEPDLIVYGQGDMIDVTAYDWYEPSQWAETRYPAGEVAGELCSPQAKVYRY